MWVPLGIFGEEKYFPMLFKWEDNGVKFSMLQSGDKTRRSHITFALKRDYTTFIDMIEFSLNVFTEFSDIFFKKIKRITVLELGA